MLPLRGKILNVLGAASAKMMQNQELADLCQAMGVQAGSRFSLEDLRYEKIIIMTDADVDGAHIASLLMTFFFTQMRPLIDHGHLYLAAPPLYRLTQGAKSVYVATDAEKHAALAKGIGGRGKIEVSRFKGLGEMMPAQLKETTMGPASRTLIRVTIAEDEGETGRARRAPDGQEARAALPVHPGERPLRRRGRARRLTSLPSGQDDGQRVPRHQAEEGLGEHALAEVPAEHRARIAATMRSTMARGRRRPKPRDRRAPPAPPARRARRRRRGRGRGG